MRYKWGDLISLEYGKPVPDKESPNGNVPVFGTNGPIGASNLPPLCKHPSFTVGRKGAYRGVYYSDIPFSVIDTAFFVENKRPDILLIKWAYYKFLTYDINRMDSGSAIPSTDRYTIYAIEVEVPSVITQAKQVAILDALSNKIVVNQQENDNLQQMAQAVFKSWFVDSPDRAAWKSGTFSDLIEHTVGGDWGKELPSGNYTEAVYCIRGADIIEVRAGNKGKMPTRYILPKHYSTKRLFDGDIVVEISGGSPTQSTGRVAIITKFLLDRYDNKIICTNFCRAMKPKIGYSMFVYHYWHFLYKQNVFFSYENGTTGIKNLNLSGFINNEKIVIPSLDAVLRFESLCQLFYNQIFLNGMENERLSSIRDTLLPRLMSGELDVSGLDI